MSTSSSDEAGSVLSVALALLLLLVVACSRNPVTGERQLALLSVEQETQLGRQAAQQVQRSIGLVENESLQSYVQRVGESIAADSEGPDLQWTFRVVDDPTPNAFALPGGFIFVTRGMLAHMASEAELAAVLGHEIGHVTARHSVEQISRQQLAQLGLGLGMIFFPEIQQFGGLFSAGLELVFLKYGRDAERQADRLGFDYALRQGYDVREMEDIFATLQRIAAQEGQSPLPVWASTHPDPGERIESIRELQSELGPRADELKQERQSFLTQIDGLVWGTNPRQGFFENNVFLHPHLAFRIVFPEGWQTQNLPYAVVAVSPQGNAAMQLTLADGAPLDAARSFLRQQGVEVGQAAQQDINGLSAVLATFAAPTQQGPVHGLVAFVAHGETTFQIVGFAPVSQYPAVDDTFLRVAESFEPLADPQVLEIQPRRVDIVRIPRPMSMSEFAKVYPSAVDVQTLVLINQVPDATTELPADTLVKRIVDGE